MDSTVGALPPPPGVTPDFKHPYSIRKFDIVTQAVCLPISTLCVLARVYTKARITPSLGPDDCEHLRQLLKDLRSLTSMCSRHLRRCLGMLTACLDA